MSLTVNLLLTRAEGPTSRSTPNSPAVPVANQRLGKESKQ